MPHELIHPNWHVVLVHYPIALLTLGLAVELLSFMYRRGTLRSAGRWMLLLGALSCVPTAIGGLYAYYDTVRFAAGQNETGAEPSNEAWYRLTRAAQAHLAPQQWDDLKHHVWRTASGTIIVMMTTIVFLGASDRWRRRLYLPCLSLAIVAVGVLLWGAWFAGESVHTRGTGMKPSATRFAIDWDQPRDAVRGVVPPLQLHGVLAGLTIAMALGALAVSIRRLNTPSDADAAVSPGVETHDVLYTDAIEPTTVDEALPAAPRPARFWLLAMLLALATAAAGVWVAAAWSWEQWPALLSQPRDLAHVIAGGGIVALTLTLAGLTRWATRRRWTIGAAATLLVLLLAAQLWTGILMLYDGSDGAASLYQFRRPTVQKSDASGVIEIAR